MKPNNIEYIAVSFKGRNYMCIANSKRHNALTRANRAWVMGYDELADDLFDEALEQPGCAFKAREARRWDDNLDGYKHLSDD